MASGGRSSTAKSSKNKAKTTAVKKNTSPAGKRKRTTKAKQQAANQLRDEVLVLLSFAVAVILLLSNFNLAGSVGVQIKWFMFGLFGVMEYIFPIVRGGFADFFDFKQRIYCSCKSKNSSCLHTDGSAFGNGIADWQPAGYCGKHINGNISLQCGA